MKPQPFFFAALSENGSPSSKRLVLFFLLFLFIFLTLYNLFTGKSPSSVFIDQLYLMLTTSLGVVFGANVLDTIKEIKTVQSNNNAKVGAPSPVQPAADAVTNVIK